MSREIFRRNVILIGCGPHYRNHYHSVLEENGLAIALLIDLEPEKESIVKFFDSQKTRPRTTVFLNAMHRNTITPQELNALLPSDFDFSQVDAVLICTEPKVRKIYTLWAFSHHLPVFMDKPVTAFAALEQSNTLFSDFLEIQQEAIHRNLDVVVSCERRAHLGYIWVFEFLRNFMEKYQIPITSIDIHFAGGVWNLPQEYVDRENHPFKYGYGILLHSGYHYVDLLVRLLSLNHILNPDCTPERQLHWLSSKPLDQIQSIGEAGYSHLLSPKEIETAFSPPFIKQLETYGETDVLVIGQDRLGRLVTNYSLKILGTSLCLRDQATFSPELDGRIKQEHVIIHLGPLCSLHISAHPYHEIDPSVHSIENFTITVMTSPFISDMRPVIQLKREDLSTLFSELLHVTSLNEHGRQRQLLDFLQKRDGNSPLASHHATIEFLNNLFKR